MPLPASTRLGPYEIMAAIGAGGMGEVYRARDLRLNREVADKILLTDTSGHPDRRARFEREARAVFVAPTPGVSGSPGYVGMSITLPRCAPSFGRQPPFGYTSPTHTRRRADRNKSGTRSPQAPPPPSA